MRIIKADVMGACFGVERALNVLNRELELRKEDPKPLYTYGQLVHNKEVIKEIEDLGVKIIEEPNGEPGVLVIRAHGISLKQYKKFEEAGYTIVDATCPIVLRNYIVMSKEKNPILLIGEEGHSETEGYRGSVKAPFFVINSVEAVASLDKKLKYSVYFQTTFSSVLGHQIREEIEKQNLKATYKSTICKASTDHRLAIDKLVKKVKIVAVIGDKSSSNSNALVNRIEKHGCTAYLIENEADVAAFPYKDAEVIGLTAAASVTDKMIEKYEKLLLAL